MIMEHFGLSRSAASRQLTRHILPVMMNDGVTLLGEEATGHDGHDTVNFEQQQQPQKEEVSVHQDQGTTMIQQQEQIQQQQPRRSVVISGVTSGLGRALFQYYCIHGHDVAGCARNHDEIQSLQLEFPEANLSVVDVTDDDAVAQWAAELEGSGMNMDVIVANAGICPETLCDSPAWEVPREEFDRTIDVNVKGVSNMVRHFVPRMIRTATTTTAGASAGQDIRGGGTFVAVSSGLGRSPAPHHAAYCASKFAIEGMMKSVAMSLPAPMCAVPLAPGVVAVEETAGTAGGMMLQQLYPSNNGGGGGGEKRMNGVGKDIHQWVHVAGPMILRLNRKDNGRSVSVKGFYSVRDRQSWIIQDGTGVPMSKAMGIVTHQCSV